MYKYFLLVLLISINIYGETPLSQIITQTKKQYHQVQPGKFVCPISRLKTTKKVIALTFDACGGKNSNGYDKELIDYLKKENIKATLCLNVRWIKKNPKIFKQLASNSLFEIESHGLRHKPASINGHSIYGIKGTANITQLIEEVELSARFIEKMISKKPHFFRSGTAWYDRASIRIIKSLGYEILNFDINSHDYAKDKSETEIANQILKSRTGSIVIMHMNHPDRNSFKALKIAIPKLKAKGFSFVKVEEYPVITVY